MPCRDNRHAFCRRRDPDFNKIELIFRSACDGHPPLLLFASPGFSPDGLRRWRVARARRGQDCEEAWWHRIAWLPPYDGSGNRRDRASRAGRTLRRSGLNQTERQNKTKCETQPHALLRRLETLLENGIADLRWRLCEIGRVVALRFAALWRTGSPPRAGSDSSGPILPDHARCSAISICVIIHTLIRGDSGAKLQLRLRVASITLPILTLPTLLLRSEAKSS